jgi:hypothetical protein
MTVGEARDDLSQYVQLHMRTTGLSRRRLADKAIDPETGETLGFQWIDRLANNQLSRAPSPKQLRALAAALGADPDIIKGLAARQWLDFEPVQLSLGKPSDWVLTVRQRNMSEEKQAELNRLVMALIQAMEDHPEGGEDRDSARA